MPRQTPAPEAHALVAVIAPEPAPWLGGVLAGLAGGETRVAVLAPWAVPAALSGLVPARLQGAVLRRVVPASLAAEGVRGLPGWPVLEAALRLWGRGRTERQMAARFVLRQVTDVLAARWVARLGGLARIIAPSCGARRTLVAARERDVRTTLVQDLPLIRQMHGDLDRAAAAHPECRFLLRYRASQRVLVQQEAEWVLADEILVRGGFARAVLRGYTGAPIEVLAGPELPRGRSASGAKSTLRVLLAGLATARNGVMEALAALSGMGATLVVRPGEGMEPPDLLRRPGVRAVSAAERERLTGVDLVLAPALCEAYPQEVPLAVSLGVPVVATSRAAGGCPQEALAAVVEPGDVAGLRAAVAALGGSQ